MTDLLKMPNSYWSVQLFQKFLRNIAIVSINKWSSEKFSSNRSSEKREEFWNV